MNAGYPVINNSDARNTLPSQGGGGPYKPYQRPGSAGGPGGPSGGPADFYRQSAAY
jgi:signal transducing adaptor molecule